MPIKQLAACRQVLVSLVSVKFLLATAKKKLNLREKEGEKERGGKRERERENGRKTLSHHDPKSCYSKATKVHQPDG